MRRSTSPAHPDRRPDLARVAGRVRPGRVRPGLVVVRGSSMQPTLRDGDLLLVGWGAAPRAGRVAVVRLPDDASGRPRPPAVKRLVRREPEGWWVERDSAVEGVDSWQVGAVPERDVLAVVLARLWPRPARALADPRE